MEPTGISRIRCLILTLMVAAFVIPATASALPPIQPMLEAVKHENAVKAKKAMKNAKVCTPAQAKAKARGTKVSCVVKPKVCTKAQAAAKAKGKKVNCVTRKVAKQTMAIAPSDWIWDDAGANDEPGQKDLVGMASEVVTGGTHVLFTWDDTTPTGSNSFDGCNLFDTDGDGNVNYSLCVSYGYDKTTKTYSMLNGYPILYACSDQKVDRCTNPTPVSLAVDPATGQTYTQCSISLVADHFDPGPATKPNNDLQADCTIYSGDMATSGVKLVNTCSYPSKEPNSDPSDCVVTPPDGYLTIVKNSGGLAGTFTFTSSVALPNNGAITTTDPINGVSDGTYTGSLSVAVAPTLRSGLPTYSVSENSLSGSGWSFVSVSCVLSDGTTTTGTVSGSSVSGIKVEAGKTTVCTYTNSRDTGSLVVAKKTVGGTGSFDFTGALGAQTLTTTVAGTVVSSTSQSLDTATNYSLTETAKTGWTVTDVTCTVAGGVAGAGSTTWTSGGTVSGIKVEAGKTTTCTYTNTRDTGSLQIAKVSTGGIGSFDFTGALGAQTLTTTVAGTAVSSAAVVKDTGSYAVSETVPAGWTLTGVECTVDGVVSTAPSVTLSSGAVTGIPVVKDKATVCTYTNSRDTGSLVVAKKTVGGTGSFDFTGALGAQTLTTTVAGTAVSSAAVVKDTGSYAVSETVPAGWTLTGVECKIGSTVKTVTVNLATGEVSGIPVEKGATSVCTYTNSRDTGSLVVAKKTVGGTGSFDFTGALGAQTLTTTVAGTVVSSTPQSLDTATNYSLTETAKTGWTVTDVTCKIGSTVKTVTVNLATGGVSGIPVEKGATTVCTYTNSLLPVLHVIKHVVNDDGGTAVASNWNLSVTPSDPAISDPGAEAPGTRYVLTPGTYTVAESGGVAGYQLTVPVSAAQACVANEAGTAGTVTLNYGDEVTCILQNDDVAPKLLLQKDVVGGTNVAADFKLSALAAAPANGRNIVDATGIAPSAEPPAGATVFANADYTLSETGPANYDSNGVWVCRYRANNELVALAAPDVRGFTDPNMVSLRLGDDVICTITNRFRDLEVVKTADKPAYAPGETVTYAVTVKNTGEAAIALSDIQVSDPDLAALGLSLTLDPKATVLQDPTLLQAGESLVFRATRPVTVAMCDAGTFANTATIQIVRNGQVIGDGNAANNTSTVTSQMTCTTDVAIAKAVTSGKPSYKPGDVVSYAITVTNTGQMTVPVASIVITDPDITGLTLAPGSPTSIGPGQSVTFTGTRLVIVAMQGQNVPNTATVTVPNDSNPGNNTASASFAVDAPVLIQGTPKAILAIDKSGAAKAIVGKNVTYTIRVKNTSTTVAENVIVSDAIPSGLTLVKTPVKATILRGVIRWNVGTLQPGQTVTFNVVMKAGGTKTTTRCNTAAALGSNADIVRDRQCTRFAKVAGVKRAPVVTG